MRFIVILIINILFITQNVFAMIDLNKNKIEQKIKNLQINDDKKNFKDINNNSENIQKLQYLLEILSQIEESKNNINKHKQIINNFDNIKNKLEKQIQNEHNKINIILTKNINFFDITQKIVSLNKDLLEIKNNIQQNKNNYYEINNFMLTFPEKLLQNQHHISEYNEKLQLFNIYSSDIDDIEYNILKAKIKLKETQQNELKIAQISVESYKRIISLRLQLLKQCVYNINHKIRQWHNYIDNYNQQQNQNVIQQNKLINKIKLLPKFIIKQINFNKKISEELNQYIKRSKFIVRKQKIITTKLFIVRKRLNFIKEQALFFKNSTNLGDFLHTQLSNLPQNSYKSEEINKAIINNRIKLIEYNKVFKNINLHHYYDVNKKEYKIFKKEIKNINNKYTKIFTSVVNSSKNILNLLISGYENEISELIKLNTFIMQLQDLLKDIKDSTHRYIFWIADSKPIDFNFPMETIKILTNLLVLYKLSQFDSIFAIFFKKNIYLLLISILIILIVIKQITKKYFKQYLFRVSTKIGKVNQDHFLLTLNTVFLSIIIACPLPILWLIIGCYLKYTVHFSIFTALGMGIIKTVPILLFFIINSKFSMLNGLFISHFGYSEDSVKKSTHYYRLCIFIIIPLILIILTLEYYNQRQFIITLGRLCFVLLCVSLSFITHKLKKIGIPLYLKYHNSNKNITNNLLWILLICIPIIAAIATLLGYISTAQELLMRFEICIIIWLISLVIYYIIRRWMLIQRRKIAFERAKQRRAEMLAQRTKDEEPDVNININNEKYMDIEDSVIDLDTISAQSLGLVRSFLTMITLILSLFIWSELHSAFSFLENIPLLNLSTLNNGINNIPSITLGSLCITILVIIITTKLIRNLPALLELIILQHINLKPGTGYAITTLTKYSITLTGIILSFWILGLEWSKIQWLIAAMGVGLGFGLQEIFANIVSGLMILIEKPIRIGDIVTIKTLTGSVTKIKTRATTLTDLDRKEIIVPNKAFITEQFMNWSLSDTITRLTLHITAPADIDSIKISQLILEAANTTKRILTTPPPETYLTDIQQGIQIFELRFYTAEMGHRMPARHEVHQKILNNFKKHGISLPFPPFQARIDLNKDEIIQKTTFKNKSIVVPCKAKF